MSVSGLTSGQMAGLLMLVYGRAATKIALSSEANPLNLPSPKPLPGRSRKVPFVLTGDDAFSLTTLLMKPIPQTGLTNEQRIFNYRLSHMRISMVAHVCHGKKL